MKKSALNTYKNINIECGLVDANGHQLIQMLMNGALDRIAQAKGAMEREDLELKGTLIGKAASIIGGLIETLDREKGGELALNLEMLYLYMCKRLIEGHSANDVNALDEVTGLMMQIKEGWDAIKDDPAVLKAVASA